MKIKFHSCKGKLTLQEFFNVSYLMHLKIIGVGKYIIVIKTRNISLLYWIKLNKTYPYLSISLDFERTSCILYSGFLYN